MLDYQKEIEIEQCPRCKKANLSGKWVELSEKNLANFLDKKIKAKELKSEKKEIELLAGDKGFAGKVTVTGKIGKEKIVLEKEISVRLKKNGCGNCQRIFGHYFEAIIQLRFSKNSLDKLESKIKEVQSIFFALEKKDPLARIVKTAMQKNGVDLIIGSNRGAKKVVRAIEKNSVEKTQVSTKLYGIDKNTGNRRYRYTYCVRF